MSVTEIARERLDSGCWDRRGTSRRGSLDANNGWIDIEMVRTLSRPLPQQQENPTCWTQPETGTRSPRKDEVKTKRPRMWNIVFYNDDYTPMDFVEFVLKRIFHLPTLDALALTLVVHTKGKGIAGTYTFEVAEQKQCEVLLMAKIGEHPLRVEVEQA
jgi:ATP-dependent Clp protease adaptor protein ClpS